MFRILLPSLFALWQQLQGIESLRVHGTAPAKPDMTIKIVEKIRPTLQSIAQNANTRAAALLQYVDALIEKLQLLV